jgi:methyl-accepting chemotaxis protein
MTEQKSQEPSQDGRKIERRSASSAPTSPEPDLHEDSKPSVSSPIINQGTLHEGQVTKEGHEGEMKGRSGALRVRFRPVTDQTQEQRATQSPRLRPTRVPTPMDMAPSTLEPDNVRIFQGREAERLELEEAIVLLQHDLEKLQAGDLRVRVRAAHKKLQPVADAINSMVAQIGDILREAQVVTLAVDEHTQKLQQSSELLARSVSPQLIKDLHNIPQVLDEMAVTMQRISEHADKVAQVAVEAMDVTLEGQSTVDRAVDGMGQVREATMQAARVMKRLGESGQEINDTVLTITDLTTRMNLLALNAAIEAVRAGEHGQGFAVIAQEMRTLAVHSTEAARKVETRMRAIQQETSTAAVSVEQNIRQVVMQTELVTQTGVALDAISVVTEQMADLVQAIAELAEHARRPGRAQGSPLPYDEQPQSSRQVMGEISQQMQLSQMQQSLTYLVDLNKELRSRISVFRINV